MIKHIKTIQEDLLKSAELTGLWEKKLRQVERGEYEARAFIDELKEMVRTIVHNVKCDNRTVELRVRAEAAGVRFSVVDHGPGVAPAQKQELFDAFYSTKANGMGMGLNICRSIAELHGSRIEVDDTPGGGATFSFLVPLAAKKA